MDPLTIGAMLGGQAISGGLGALGSYLSAKEQRKAADRAAGVLGSSYNKAEGYQQPYMQAGQVGLDRMLNGNYDVAVPGAYQSSEQQPTYTADQFNFQQDPGYQFQLQQGLGAITGSAAGHGAGLSGATQKALMKYGTGLANQSYGDAFNRYMQGRQQNFGEFQTGLGQYNTNRAFGAGQQQQGYENANQQATQRYGRASDLGQMGQAAANNLGTLASNYGSNMAGLYGQQGNSNAAGQMGMMQGFGQIGQGISQAGTLAALYGKGK